MVLLSLGCEARPELPDAGAGSWTAESEDTAPQDTYAGSPGDATQAGDAGTALTVPDALAPEPGEPCEKTDKSQGRSGRRPKECDTGGAFTPPGHQKP